MLFPVQVTPVQQQFSSEGRIIGSIRNTCRSILKRSRRFQWHAGG